MRVIQIFAPGDLKKAMQEINVDPCGIKIMVPKGRFYVIRVDGLPCIAANILKQEMLSVGADAALARESLTGKIKATSCLLLGNLAQLKRFCVKLDHQPFGLKKISRELSTVINKYEKDSFVLKTPGRSLNLSKKTRIMGIINVTPDSFSSDGFYGQDAASIVEYAQKLIKDGADIIDVGGESSRPGAKPVSLKEELSRVIPVIKALAKRCDIPISVDTCKPEVAKEAVKNGALIVNDITGLSNPLMLKVIAQTKAAAIIMHMRGDPRSMQKKPFYGDVVSEIIEYLSLALNNAVSAGIDPDRIILDPGIGFGKNLSHNLEIIKRLKEFKVLGRPLLIGTSRKSFIGKILNVEPDNRLYGTIASCVLASSNGARIVRVHDVKEVSQALKISDRIINNALENNN